MCIIDILEFIEDYINKKSMLNYGEFYYNSKQDIINFSNNVIENMNKYFGDNYNIISYDSTNIVAKIKNSIYKINIINNSNHENGNDKYEWLVNIN